MKLATFDAGAGDELGSVVGDTVIPLSRAAPALGADMRALITGWGVVEAEVRRIVAAGEDSLPLNAVKLRAPIARPCRRNRHGAGPATSPIQTFPP